MTPVHYVGFSPGVDEALTQVQLTLGHMNNQIKLLGLTPTAGNGVLSQTAQNCLQIIELTKSQGLPAYPGVRGTLATGSNASQVALFEKAINATHFYGKDALMDVGGWPNVTISLKNTTGVQKVVEDITKADEPIALIATGPLTTLSEALSSLEVFTNIKAIYIRGGCVQTATVCDAPPNVPDNKKNSERMFFLDVPAAQNVFSLAAAHNIPIYLATLDLVQQPDLLWTKEQVKQLKAIDNAVAQKLAEVTDIVPYLYARRFPADTFPMGALFAGAALLRPDLFNATREAVTIGNVGQIFINPNATDAEKNVHILTMNEETASQIYQILLDEYKQFTCWLDPSHASCGLPLSTILEIAVPAGVGAIGLLTLLVVCVYRSKARIAETDLEKRPLILVQEDGTAVQDFPTDTEGDK